METTVQMTPERWREIDRVFQAALERAPHERLAFLDEVCNNDGDLRTEVESLISCADREDCFVDAPALEAAASFLALDEPELAAGQHLSHYEILNLLGAGGMGEVYLAKDKKLGRKLALKLLPADYTRDKDRLRRFQQEAQAASALNHPNILTIYELGQVGGQQFIATEFVEGETLRQRLNRAPLTLSETVDIAFQMASALSAAHRAGIVHRDIKPENIMLRPDGYVKILDFGLAKLTQQEERFPKPIETDKTEISSGLVMGTVKYMSPEQAQGLQVDQRSDIFSFGVVLYEILAGRAPFEGETSTELITSILRKQPASLTNAPDELRRLVSRALLKKKEDRYQTIEDVLVDLKALREDKAITGAGAHLAPQTVSGSALSTSASAGVSTVSTFEYVVSGIKRHKTGAAFILASLAIVSVGLTLSLNRLSSRVRATAREMKITHIPNMDKVIHAAVSPNGEYIAYAEMSGVPAKSNTEQSLWVLEIATNSRAQIMPPSDVDYVGLTYSQDGREMFYVSNYVLYEIPAGGGEATKVLLDVGGTVSFAPDGKQVAFVRVNGEETALMVANVDGSGERVVATRKKPEFINPEGPAWSPDGCLIACWVGVMATSSTRSVIGFDATTGEEKKITDQKWDEISSPVIWLADGSGIIAAADGPETAIWEIPYPSGEAHRVTSDSSGYYEISLTSDGKNLMALGGALRSNIWLMPNGDPGAAMPITYGEHFDLYVSLTPDGKILNAPVISGHRDIWIMNPDGTNPRQLTTNAGVNMQPEASKDGRYIVFSSNRANKGAYNLWRMNMDGSNPVQLTHGSGEGQPVCSPDGRWVVYSQGEPNTTAWKKTLWKVSIDGGESAQLNDKPSSGPAISPDGTLIACWYAPDPPTQDPPPVMKIALIPIAGGPPIKILDATRTYPVRVRWSPDGQAVDYVKGRGGVSNIWSQPISGDPVKQITQFTSERIGGFDWSRDGTLLCSRAHNVGDVVLITDFR